MSSNQQADPRVKEGENQRTAVCDACENETVVRDFPVRDDVHLTLCWACVRSVWGTPEPTQSGGNTDE